MRHLIAGIVGLALLAGLGVGVYAMYFQSEPAPVAPQFHDKGEKLSTPDEFEILVQKDPVEALAAALTRYQRDVRGGVHFTMEKQERVKGEPKHPSLPPVEVIDAWVRGDVPDAKTNATSIEVEMKWISGAKRAFFSEIRATLFSEKPKAEGGLGGKVYSWRPEAVIGSLTGPLDPNLPMAREQSRYCIRDAGLYRSMLRTHLAWKACQEAGTFKFEYLGKKVVEKTGGRECYVIKRICDRPELDSFELGGTVPTDPKTITAEGFTEVTISIDAANWLQLGSELYRTEADGTRVLVGAYYFRDVKLNPEFPPETFTLAGLKK
jgi:hypothetical protein